MFLCVGWDLGWWVLGCWDLGWWILGNVIFWGRWAILYAFVFWESFSYLYWRIFGSFSHKISKLLLQKYEMIYFWNGVSAFLQIPGIVVGLAHMINTWRIQYHLHRTLHLDFFSCNILFYSPLAQYCMTSAESIKLQEGAAKFYSLNIKI